MRLAQRPWPRRSSAAGRRCLLEIRIPHVEPRSSRENAEPSREDLGELERREKERPHSKRGRHHTPLQGCSFPSLFVCCFCLIFVSVSSTTPRARPRAVFVLDENNVYSLPACCSVSYSDFGCKMCLLVVDMYFLARRA